MVHGRAPDLLRPRRYTEKVQWRKLFDLDPRYAMFCDKLATRGLIAARFGADLVPPLLWTGTPETLPLDTLAPPYVLKSNHASGQVVMVEAGDRPDRAALQATTAAWLARNHGSDSNEPGYGAVTPRLLIERTVRNAAGAPPDEQRIFVFHGTARVVNTVFVEDGRVRNGAFHTPDWQRLNWHFTRLVDRPFPRPPCLDAMLRIAEALGQELDHVRVDFFDGGARFWVGETTLYPWSGLARFEPDSADFDLGAFWRLPNPMGRAAMAVALRAPEIPRVS